MSRYYTVTIPVPSSKEGMWYRQHKMYVGKWHLKTLLLLTTLCLIGVVYFRVQDAQQTGVREIRNRLEVHAYGAKPYKSLALTRKMGHRNRTSSAKGRRGRKKGGSLSLAEHPGRKGKPSRGEERKLDRERTKGGKRFMRVKERFQHGKRGPMKNRPDDERPPVTRQKELQPNNSTADFDDTPKSNQKAINPISGPKITYPQSSSTPIRLGGFPETSNIRDAVALRQGAPRDINGTPKLLEGPESRVKSDMRGTEDKRHREESSSKDNMPYRSESETPRKSKPEHDAERENKEDREGRDRSTKNVRTGGAKNIKDNDRESIPINRERSDKRSRPRDNDKDSNKGRDDDQADERGRSLTKSSEQKRRHGEDKLSQSNTEDRRAVGRSGTKTSSSLNGPGLNSNRAGLAATNESLDNAPSGNNAKANGSNSFEKKLNQALQGNDFKFNSEAKRKTDTQSLNDTNFSDLTLSTLPGGLSAKERESVAGLFSGAGTDNEGISSMQIQPGPGVSDTNNTDSSVTEDDQAASNVWDAIHHVLKSHASSVHESGETNRAGELPPSAPYREAHPMPPVMPRFREPDMAEAGYGSRSASASPDVYIGDGYVRDLPRDFRGGYLKNEVYVNEEDIKRPRLASGGRAYERVITVRRPAPDPYYGNRRYAVEPEIRDQYDRVNSREFEPRRFDSYGRSDVVDLPPMEGPRSDGYGRPIVDDFTSHEQVRPVYNRFQEDSHLQVPRGRYAAQDTQESGGDLLKDDEDGVEEGDDDFAEDSEVAGDTDTASEEDAHASLSPDEAMRARMAQYAAISARNDPGPAEIKPVTRLDRAHSVHAIPQ